MVQTLLRIGAGAGYAGDRIPPALALAEKGQLDYLVFECLAERTIALAQLEKIQNPLRGFDPLLWARMNAVCDQAKTAQSKCRPRTKASE